LYSYPTASGQNGFTQTSTVASLATIPSSGGTVPQNLTSLTLDPGVYILSGNASTPSSNNPIYLAFCLTPVSAALSFAVSRGFTVQLQTTVGGGVGANASTVILSINTTQTWILAGETLTAGNWTDINLTAVRVA
jgi:hypothetical protein